MTSDLGTLSLAAVSVGFLHCVSGPDHYLPFVAMSRGGLWSLRKTLLVTALCGIGHVAGSAVIGLLGITVGFFLYQLEAGGDPLLHLEKWRGDLAAWALTMFGAAYAVWGVWHAGRRVSSADESGTGHGHSHTKDLRRLTPWILFTIFVFGPCEPLIPLLMYPAAKANLWSVAIVTLLFGATTLVTMTVIVFVMHRSLGKLQLRWLEAYNHTLAGFVLLGCGLAMLLSSNN